MRKRFIFLMQLLCLLNLGDYCLAAGAILKGRVTLQNSGGKPVAWVQIDADDANPIVSKTSGEFTMRFPYKKPGDSVRLIVEKKDMEVVNRDNLVLLLPRNPENYRHEIVMCEEGERERWALIYYGITSDAINKNYEKFLKQIKEAGGSGTGKRNEALAQLELKRESALAQAKKMAENYAEVNLDEVSELYRKAFNYFRQKSIKKALDVLEDPKINEVFRIVKERKEMAEEDIKKSAANCYMLKARLHILNLKFKKAGYYYREAIKINPGDFDNIFEFAYFLGEQNQHHESLFYYKRALLHVSFGRKKAKTFNNLGNQYSNINQFSDALVSYEKALGIYRELAEIDPQEYSLYVAVTLNHLALLYKRLNRSGDSLPLFKEALEITKKRAAENSGDHLYLQCVAQTFNNLGVLYRDINRLNNALDCYKKALKVYRKLVRDDIGVHLPEVARTLNNLASIYLDKNRLKDALPFFEEALAIKRKLAEKNPWAHLPSMARTLNNLASLYLQKKQFSDALVFLKEALDISQKLAANNPLAYLPYKAETLSNLGVLYKDTNRTDDALRTYERVLKIYRKLAEKNPRVYLPSAAETLRNLGALYETVNRLNEALACYKELFRILNRLEIEDKPPGEKSSLEF
jgi:tetratricopeptide (TPR) repeat protein